MIKKFLIKNKQVTLFYEKSENVPVVYLNTVHGEGGAVWDECLKRECPPFALAAISNLNWDDDMSPWAIPPISENDTPCGGRADEFLALLAENIVPAVNGFLQAKPVYNAIAGYSLAGLFALYSLYKTDVFLKAASASGSFWFPDFCTYAAKNSFCAVPESLYFSLGDKESKTKNPLLNTVEDNTKFLENFYGQSGIKTVFVSNKGNHFQNAVPRMADAIKWILEN